jgi:hypothetical protein
MTARPGTRQIWAVVRVLAATTSVRERLIRYFSHSRALNYHYLTTIIVRDMCISGLSLDGGKKAVFCCVGAITRSPCQTGGSHCSINASAELSTPQICSESVNGMSLNIDRGRDAMQTSRSADMCRPGSRITCADDPPERSDALFPSFPYLNILIQFAQNQISASLGTRHPCHLVQI